MVEGEIVAPCRSSGANRPHFEKCLHWRRPTHRANYRCNGI